MEEDCKVIKFHARDNCALNQDCISGDAWGTVLLMSEHESKNSAPQEVEEPILAALIAAMRTAIDEMETRLVSRMETHLIRLVSRMEIRLIPQDGDPPRLSDGDEAWCPDRTEV